MAYLLRDAYNRQIPIMTTIHLGTDPSNQIILSNPQVASLHATLWEDPNGLFIRDENSPIGTYVNQNRIQGTVALRAGDQFSISSAVFMIDNAPAFQSPPPPLPVAPEKKKAGGCWKWGLVGLLLFLVLCLVLGAGGGYYLYTSNPEVKNLITDLNILPTPIPELDANGDQIGPVDLDLKDPALNTSYSTSVRHVNSSALNGFDQNNNPITRLLMVETMQQTQPEWSSYGHSIEKLNEKSLKDNEYVLLKGNFYTAGGNPVQCTVRKDTGKNELEQWPEKFLNSNAKGHVQRVETGVMINGVMSDRYELKLVNVGTSSAIELKSGSLYRARKGGYLVSFEYTLLIKAQSYGMNIGGKYSSDKPAEVTFHEDFTYYPAGTMKVKIPAACIDKVQP